MDVSFRFGEEVKAVVEDWVNAKGIEFFNSGIMSVERRWIKCIMLEAYYIE